MINRVDNGSHLTKEPAGKQLMVITGEERPTPNNLRVFVVMPFAHSRDLYRFGIELAVHLEGLDCQRIDREAFTGDIVDRIKTLIETADLVIADVTGGNANVAFELGWAGGKGRPTILLCKVSNRNQGPKLPFDLRGQKCLLYWDISDLHDQLRSELRGLVHKLVA